MEFEAVLGQVGPYAARFGQVHRILDQDEPGQRQRADAVFRCGLDASPATTCRTVPSRLLVK
ncbi:MAG TPA: hypothetical protein VM347_31540 [Nonomuraea sp.]|nr:hypothetical protein [Nonomuraea sp.]